MRKISKIRLLPLLGSLFMIANASAMDRCGYGDNSMFKDRCIETTTIKNNLGHDVSVSGFDLVRGCFKKVSSTNYGWNDCLRSGDKLTITAGNSLTLNFLHQTDDETRYGSMIINTKLNGNLDTAVYYGYTGGGGSRAPRFWVGRADKPSSMNLATDSNADSYILYSASVREAINSRDGEGKITELSLIDNVCAMQPTVDKYLRCLKD